MVRCDPDLRWRLIRVAQGLDAPDLLVWGGRVWNAFTGEVFEADVAVCGDRIARVGPWEGPMGDATVRIDARGFTIVPGYIEPHTHPWPFHNPLSLAEAAVCRGTTFLVYDNLLLYLALGAEAFGALAAALTDASLGRIRWVARIASQSWFPQEAEVFSEEAVLGMLGMPEFVAAGEMTRWTDLLRPDRARRLLRLIEGARGRGRFADGHTAGASRRRLPALAAAGLRSCHEAITADEVLERLRQGLWVLLRHSSLREDLEELLPALGRTRFLDRITLTTDGAKAHQIARKGLTDHLIREALAAGVPSGTAYVLATRNAAAFLGLDDDLGAVAPGRLADMNLLRDLSDPTPCVVIVGGRVVARDGRLTVPPPSRVFPWESAYAGAEPRVPVWGPDRFLLPGEVPDPFPAGRLVNAVITREEPVPLTRRGAGRWPRAGDAHVVALTDRTGSWISRGVVLGLGEGLRAVASSYTTNGGLVVAGQDPAAMADALGRLRALGGGIVVLLGNGRVEEFPLPLAGIQMPGPFGPAAEAASAFQRAMEAGGYAHSDPNYTLLFLSCDFLPDLRVTRRGWVRVKADEVVVPWEPAG
ncbi:adenine deaminase C-terminal domain-containing protein [Deferrisoma camini]|uniref:adenine deaminase C-terminal domain-containing protein n=1 Tax=Deferrisoma camini TaxID=1035120 RepID=UPI00046D65E7|nr:adenine deaminase C-terminal domain-containing protein [Deferrisoma camini]